VQAKTVAVRAATILLLNPIEKLLCANKRNYQVTEIYQPGFFNLIGESGSPTAVSVDSHTEAGTIKKVFHEDIADPGHTPSTTRCMDPDRFTVGSCLYGLVAGSNPVPVSVRRCEDYPGGCPFYPSRNWWDEIVGIPESKREVEEYRVDLSNVTVLELVIKPNVDGGVVRASLKNLRLS
jgi:hypothetical protein